MAELAALKHALNLALFNHAEYEDRLKKCCHYQLYYNNGHYIPDALLTQCPYLLPGIM
jgi:hypothetical protein